MPELPEVETVKNTLKELVTGHKIIDVEIGYSKIVRGISVDDFKTKLIGQTINKLNRIGKYLIFELDDYALISHLRMEGKFFYRSTSFESKHDHICFKLSNNHYLIYNDTRKFGTMNVESLESYKSAHYLTKLGLEPLDSNLTGDYLYEKLRNKNVAVKTALLDQGIISGLGNIYVDETLHLSKIMPTKKCNTLTKAQCKAIVEAAFAVIKKAISEGGTTVKSFSASEGVHGRFQNHLNVHTKKICGTCGEEVTKIKVNGRGTYYCSRCQKL